MFVKVKWWDDRRVCDQKQCIKGRTWVRRIQWLEDQDGRVKLKFDDGELYREVITTVAMAQIIWDRFKSGQSIADAISILAQAPPISLASKKGLAANGSSPEPTQ